MLNENISKSLIAILAAWKSSVCIFVLKKMDIHCTVCPRSSVYEIMNAWMIAYFSAACHLTFSLPLLAFVFFWFVYEKIPKSVNVYWKSIKFVLPEWKICFWYNYCAYLQAPALKTHPEPRNWILPPCEFSQTFFYTL